MPSEKKVILADKPCVHRFRHLLVARTVTPS